ncbi:hypothetical protein GGI12_003090 [Dipsacomyces acuminosporus]|nr:hypothetical protein GGI12_003090 [Dipsacomyces acuminosporus]
MRIRRALRLAIEAGYSVLFNGGSAVSAVEAAARRLEDYDLFNAGKGSAISILGHPLLDATICDGSKQRGASVALVSAVRNPINLARRILEHGSIPMVASLTAQKYAELFKIKQIDPISLNIDHRVHEYHKWRATSSVLDCMECANSASDAKNADATRKDRSEGGQISPAAVFPDGGVGAVAVDKYGKVAAASSSGGSVGRLAGQITESGCIGASTWADNLFAVSGISSNSQCIYQQTAHTIALRARYRKEHIRSATASTLADLLMSTGAEGAFVAIDNKGAFAVVYSADNMVRGYCSSATNHEPHVAIYADEPLPACNDIHIEQPDHV